LLVVGGGPGGMEAARILARKGHEVVLCEASDRLGGNLIPAAAASFKKEIQSLTDYLSAQMTKLPVTVELNRRMTSGEIKKYRPDMVVLAIGAEPVMPDIPGIDRGKAVSAVDVLNGAPTGQRVVVVGGGMIGAETAIYLKEQGKDVTLVSRRTTQYTLEEGLAPDMPIVSRLWFNTVKWPQAGIPAVPHSKYHEITGEGLVVMDSHWQKQLLPADTVVFALGLSPRTDIRPEDLQGIKVFKIGDCLKPRRIIDAVKEAALVCQRID
ncbi:MAG: FAD-dependent oxidoreductase, partial [Firmicutes bacterium]|nr:FAD-dependent oxidoreductase [Bacillota bacterium]